MARKIFVEFISALLIVLFLYAAVAKLLDYHNFIIKLGRDPFINQFAHLIAILLPATEIIAVILLARSSTRVSGLWLSLTTMIAFTVYVALVLTIAPKIPCTCGGFIQALSWKAHLIFNICWVIAIAIALFFSKSATVKNLTFPPELIGSN